MLRMNRNDNHRLASSAIRIYLMHELHHAEDLLRSYELQERIAHSPLQRSYWKGVACAAQRVITYIKNCRGDEEQVGFFVRAFHGLSAIGAAQEALANRLLHVRTSHLGSEAPGIYFQYLSQDHELRAKCLVNALVSINRQDQELAVLWEQGAAHILLHCQMRRRETEERPLAMRHMYELHQLSNVLREERHAGASVPVNVRELNVKAKRTYQLTTVCTILEIGNDYHSATSCYTRAAALCKQARAEGVSPAVAKLWMLAVSALQLAGEMAESHALSRVDPNDPIYNNLKLEVEYFIDSAHNIGHYSHWERDLNAKNNKAQSEAKGGTSSVLVSLRTALAAEQAKVLLVWEQYKQCLMEGLSNRSAAEELAKQFYAARNTVLRAETSVKEVEASVERAAFYTDQITKCAHIANGSLRQLWGQCWTRAADLTNTEIQLSTEFVVDGEFQRLTHDRENSRKLCQLKARMYVSNAMCELSTADEYFRAACGAEANKTSNRDPREVEWWRCAAALQTTALEKCMSCIDDIVDVGQGEEQCLKQLCKSVEESRRGADAYATATDYMRRANQLRTTLSHLEYAVSVAELLTKAEKGEAVSYTRAQMFCLKLIDVKSGVKKNVPAEMISLLERSCTYIRQWINALAADSKSAMSWRTTLSVCFQAYQTSKTGWNEQASISVLMATVFAKQAETQLHDYDYYVYMCAATAMDKAREACATSGCKDVNVANHLAVIAARVCMLSKLETPVPEELVRFAQEVTVDGRVEPILQDCVEAHRLKAECLSECLQMGVDGAKHKLLSQAHSELNSLMHDYESQLQYTIHPHAEGKRISDQHIIHILKTSALRRVSAKCCMALHDQGHVFGILQCRCVVIRKAPYMKGKLLRLLNGMHRQRRQH